MWGEGLHGPMGEHDRGILAWWGVERRPPTHGLALNPGVGG